MVSNIIYPYASGDFSFSSYRQYASEAKAQIAEIRADIGNELTSDAAIDAINTPSAMGMWELIADICAYIQWISHGTWVRFEQRLFAARDQSITHGPAWLADKVKQWQFGSALQVVNGAIGYATINTALQIAKAVAVTELNGRTVVKVAKVSSGVYQPLNSTEKASLSAYLRKVLDCGVSFFIVTEQADLMRLQAAIYYDGVLDVAIVKANVEAVINNFIAQLLFDGVYSIQSMVDALQKIPGVKDIHIQGAQIRPNSAANFTQVLVNYKPLAGYMKVDPAAPLSSSISYIAA